MLPKKRLFTPVYKIKLRQKNLSVSLISVLYWLQVLAVHVIASSLQVFKTLQIFSLKNFSLIQNTVRWSYHYASFKNSNINFMRNYIMICCFCLVENCSLYCFLYDKLMGEKLCVHENLSVWQRKEKIACLIQQQGLKSNSSPCVCSATCHSYF